MPTLRTLEAKLLRCVIETSLEKDAEGKFIFRGDDGEIHMWSATSQRTIFEPVETLAEAHGIRFLCPKSFAQNGGSKGTHSVYIFFTGSPYAGHNSAGQEVRWQVVAGTGLDDLQLSPSILEQDNHCQWHGFVGTSGVPPGSAA